MSRKRHYNGPDEMYRKHLQGTSFSQNPANNRFAMIERMYMRILTELATNRFKWVDMPEEIDVRFLELTLFYYAVSVFYYDYDFEKFLALRGGSSGWLNMMDQPRYLQVIGNNFVGRTLDTRGPTITRATGRVIAGQAIPIWANYLRVPDLDIVELYSSKLAEIDRTLEINAKNARQTKFLTYTENQRLTMANILRQFDEGNNAIQVSGMFADGIPVQAFDLGIDPNLLAAIRTERAEVWRECMSLLGIDNTNQDKRENVVVAEATGNKDQISNMRYVNLNARRQACAIINDVYGLDVSVEYWTDAERNAVIATQAGNDGAGMDTDVMADEWLRSQSD